MGDNGELYINSELTATQDLSTSLGAVDTVASGDRSHSRGSLDDVVRIRCTIREELGVIKDLCDAVHVWW